MDRFIHPRVQNGPASWRPLEGKPLLAVINTR
jgi:hypothetical protein